MAETDDDRQDAAANRRAGGTPAGGQSPPAAQESGLLHQLSERLTAAGNYLKALQRGAAIVPEDASRQSAEILERALAQLDQAGELFRRLRQALNEPSPARDGAGRDYRVCFMYGFAGGDAPATACQRSIVIRSARSPEAAIESAKKHFTEIEGIRDWRIHASMIEAGLLADDSVADCEIA